MELVITGDRSEASELHRLGLVNLVVPKGEAREKAHQLAARIAENWPLAIAASKRVMVESQDWDLGETFERQRQITTPIFASADARECALAFAQKHKPRWEGR